jgi:hypothetical protein
VQRGVQRVCVCACVCAGRAKQRTACLPSAEGATAGTDSRASVASAGRWRVSPKGEAMVCRGEEGTKVENGAGEKRSATWLLTAHSTEHLAVNHSRCYTSSTASWAERERVRPCEHGAAGVAKDHHAVAADGAELCCATAVHDHLLCARSPHLLLLLLLYPTATVPHTRADQLAGGATRPRTPAASRELTHQLVSPPKEVRVSGYESTPAAGVSPQANCERVGL